MKKYTELNAQMEKIACVIRQLYLFEDKHNSEEDIQLICDFVEHMRSLENINSVDKKYTKILDEYLNKIDNLHELAPDIF